MKWRYYTSESDWVHINHDLDVMGNAGWELVSVRPHPIFSDGFRLFFKRLVD